MVHEKSSSLCGHCRVNFSLIFESNPRDCGFLQKKSSKVASSEENGLHSSSTITNETSGVENSGCSGEQNCASR